MKLIQGYYEDNIIAKLCNTNLLNITEFQQVNFSMKSCEHQRYKIHYIALKFRFAVLTLG
jgi:hypothetical protein